MTPECIIHVIARNGQKVFSERMSTARPAPRVSFAVADKCCSNSRSSEPDRVPGNRDEIVITQNAEMKSHKMMIRLKLRLLFSARSILEFVGILQEAVLQDKMQVKSIAELRRKLEQSKVDLGENSNQENYVFTREIAERFMIRTMSNL